MGVHVILGEPFCRSSTQPEVHVELAEGECLPLSELFVRLDIEPSGREESPLFVLNGRVLSHDQAATAILRNGDRLVVQLMLAGG